MRSRNLNLTQDVNHSIINVLSEIMAWPAENNDHFGVKIGSCRSNTVFERLFNKAEAWQSG